MQHFRRERPITFLDLPAEVRIEIYDLLLVERQTVRPLPAVETGLSIAALQGWNPLSQACQKTRADRFPREGANSG